MTSIIRFLLLAALCAGCVSNHLKLAAPTTASARGATPNLVTGTPAVRVSPQADTVAPIVDNSVVELAALRAAPVVPPNVTAPITTSPGLTVAPALAAPVLAGDVALITPPTVVTTAAATTAKAIKSHKLSAWLLGIIFFALGISAAYSGWPCLKKFLAWVKKKNVLKDFDNLAKSAADKIEVDFKDVRDSSPLAPAVKSVPVDQVKLPPHPLL